MFLTAHEQRALGTCFALLAEDLNEREIRQRIGLATLDLFRADQFASYVWDAQNACFDHGVSIHMDSANLNAYEQWYQYRDPITPLLQRCRHATRVSQVLPRSELLKSEFFNDFLARDGLHWGINLHAFDGSTALGDLRIWRRRGKNDFNDHDQALLNLLEPAFVSALRRAHRLRSAAQGQAQPGATTLPQAVLASLSGREREVAQCVFQGLSDKEIARQLDIALPSVRTYLQRIFAKLGVKRRTALAQWAAHTSGQNDVA